MLEFLPDYNLILSGNNSTEYANNTLKKTIKKMGFEKRVIITGKITDIDKQYYLKNCTAFVFPSLREGFGIPPIEAMRFGKPVFLSNSTSLPEIGGENAFYWNDYEPNYMADVLKKGLNIFEKDRVNLSKKNIVHAKSFNWDKAAKQYIEVYKSILFGK